MVEQSFHIKHAEVQRKPDVDKVPMLFYFKKNYLNYHNLE